MLNVFWQIKVVVCEASRRLHVSAVPGRGFCRNISSKPGLPGEAQCCGGLLVAGKRKPPHVDWYKPGNLTEAKLDPQHIKDSRERLPLQQGGYMTLTQLGVAFWHDLAAPIIAGIIASVIVNWLRDRK